MAATKPEVLIYRLVDGKPDIRFTGFETKTGFKFRIPFPGLKFFLMADLQSL
jgi:hypothetical protein